MNLNTYQNMMRYRH